MEKRYSAFISSQFGGLKQERQAVYECLLDRRIFPFGMEYFTASSSENFSYVKKLIDQSDIFIMLLGDIYGSRDENGVSWTQREFEYASQLEDMKTFVLLMPSFLALSERAQADPSALTQDEHDLVAFGEGITYAQRVPSRSALSRTVRQCLTGIDFDELTGWERGARIDEARWRRENARLDLRGKWYHVHLKDEDSEDAHEYIRIGVVNIKQDFSSSGYSQLELSGENYSVKSYNPETGEIAYNRLKRTLWSGDYRLYEDGSIKGIYYTKREFKEQYGDWIVKKGEYCGVHELIIVDDDGDGDASDTTTMLQGVYRDCAPSMKEGVLCLFRSRSARLDFLRETRPEVLLSRQV